MLKEMHIYALAIIGACVIALLPQYAQAQAEVTPEYKAQIDSLLEVSNAEEAGDAMIKQIMGAMIPSLKKSHPDIPPRFFEIVKEEAIAAFKQDVANKEINKLAYGVYAKRFSLEELKQISAFYETPAGKKAAREIPGLMQEMMVEANMHYQTVVMPKVMQRVMVRASAEGIMPKE